MKKKLTVLFIFSTLFSFGQINLEDLLEGGLIDTQKFLQNYLEPAPNGFGYGINGGWYTTAKAHKPLGFDIRVIANTAFVPSKAETFTFNNADYTNIKLNDPSLTSAKLPTLFGSQKLEDRPILDFTQDGNTVSISSLPGVGIEESTGYNVVPSAMVQLGVGLFKNTDLKIRFVPKISETDFEFSTFGIGVMHDIKQWIPFVKKLPIDVSFMASWSDTKSKFFLDSNDPTSDQALEFNTNTYLFQLVGSKKISIVTFYGGLGVSSFSSNLNMLGTYESSNTNTTYVDPISLDFSGTSFRGNLGLNIKLLVLNISAEYALQEYSTFTATVGFSIR